MARPLPKSTLTFAERYQELRELGVPQWEIANRLGLSIESLVRYLQRERLPVDPFTCELVQESRVKNGTK